MELTLISIGPMTMLLRILQRVAIFSFATTFIPHPAFANGNEASRKSSVQFEFELSTEEVERLEKGLAQLKLGDSVARVKSLLGKPSAEGNLYRKHVVGRGAFVSRYMDYNVKLVRMNLKSLNDHVIALSFDARGALITAKRLGYSKSNRAANPKSIQIVEKIL